jgi:predicted lactoylglutathione lyase
MDNATQLTAILPCRDLGASQAFYTKLGFTCRSDYGNYRILADGRGAHLHLNHAETGLLAEGHNPFGLYLYAQNVDQLAASLGGAVLHRPEHKPWGMYEFAFSDPDGTLVRIGWPSKQM